MKNKINYIILVVLALLFWELNHSLPMVMDDASYAYNLDINHYEAPHFADAERPISSFGDVIESQKLHYMVDNGRTPVHVLVQVMCGMCGKTTYDIVATVMFVLLVIITTDITDTCADKFTTDITDTCADKFTTDFTDTCAAKRAALRVAPILMLFLFLSEPKCWWNGIAHSINYLWTTVAVLGFLVITTRKGTTENTETCAAKRAALVCNNIKRAALPILGLLAGWSHECLAVGVGAGLMYWTWKNWKKIGEWEIAGIVAFYIGAALLVFSPANFMRSEGMALGEVLMRPVKLVYVSWPCMLLACVTGVWLWRKGTLKSFMKENLFWVIAAVTAGVFVLVSGVVTRRAVYGMELFVILMCTTALTEKYTTENTETCAAKRAALSDNTKKRAALDWCGVVLIVLMGVMLPYQIYAGKQYREIEDVVMAHEGAVMGVDEDGDEIEIVEIPRAGIVAPRFFNKYICRFLTDEECHGSEDLGNTAFQEWVWEWKGKYEHELVLK